MTYACHTTSCCRRHRRALCAVNFTNADPLRRGQSRAAAVAAPGNRSCTVASSAERAAPLRFRCPPPDETVPRNASIPSVVHFVYALRRNAPFGWGQYVAIRSALAVHRPARALFHHFWEPSGPWWDLVRQELAMVRHEVERVEHGEGRCLSHHAHRADWLRLQALVREGGLYLDMDTISLRPLPAAVRASEFAIAWQLPPGTKNREYPCTREQPEEAGAVGGGSHGQTWRCGGTAHQRALSRGLCNAVMAAAPAARFAKHWLASYASFRSGGRDSLWDEHSVGMPARLWERCDALRGAATLLPSAAFFPFYWLEAATTLRRPWSARVDRLLRQTSVLHLWNSGRRRGSSGGRRSASPPLSPTEPCSEAYARTTIGHLSCTYAARAG